MQCIVDMMVNVTVKHTAYKTPDIPIPCQGTCERPKLPNIEPHSPTQSPYLNQFSYLTSIFEPILKPQVLPRVAAEVSAPLAQTDKITMVSTGDGPVGASKLTEEVRLNA